MKDKWIMVLNYLLIASESIIWLILNMNNKLLGVLLHILCQPTQWFDCNWSPKLIWNTNISINKMKLTFFIKIINVMICNNKVSLLLPAVLIPLKHLAWHHKYFRAVVYIKYYQKSEKELTVNKLWDNVLIILPTQHI